MVQDDADLFLHPLIGEAPNFDTGVGEDTIALGIIRGIVDGAVYFHDKRGLVTVKVGDETGDDLLTAEMLPERPRLEALPKQGFRRVHVTTHLTRKHDFFFSDLLADYDSPRLVVFHDLRHLHHSLLPPGILR